MQEQQGCPPGWFQALTGSQDSVDELLPGDLPVLVLVDAPEEIHDPGFLVVHPAHVLLPPDVKIEVCKLLQLEGKPRESQWGKCQRDSTHRATPKPLWVRSQPSWEGLFGFIQTIPREGAAQTELPAQDTQQSRQPARGLCIPGAGDAAVGDTQAGKISYRHTQTHTQTPSARPSVGASSPQGLAREEFPLPASFWAWISPLPFPQSSQEGISCSSSSSTSPSLRPSNLSTFLISPPQKDPHDPTSSSSSHQGKTTFLRGFGVFFCLSLNILGVKSNKEKT